MDWELFAFVVIVAVSVAVSGTVFGILENRAKMTPKLA